MSAEETMELSKALFEQLFFQGIHLVLTRPLAAAQPDAGVGLIVKPPDPCHCFNVKPVWP